MSDAQRHTVDLYYAMLHANAISQCLRSTVSLGVVDQLLTGQKDLATLATACRLQPELLQASLGILVAVGFVEQYGDDYALSQAARLLASDDPQFGEACYGALADRLTGKLERPTSIEIRRQLNQRQWTHTAAAIQAAEVLDIGNSRKGMRVLVLGAGTGVWIGAMAYRDPTMHVTIVDEPHALAAAGATLASIDVASRIQQVAADYRTWDVPLGAFDWVVLAEVLQWESDAEAVVLLGRAADALHAEGQVVLLEPLREEDGPPIPMAMHQWELLLAGAGPMRSTPQIQRLLRGAGFGDAQWGWLTASHQGVGLIIAPKNCD